MAEEPAFGQGLGSVRLDGERVDGESVDGERVGGWREHGRRDGTGETRPTRQGWRDWMSRVDDRLDEIFDGGQGVCPRFLLSFPVVAPNLVFKSLERMGRLGRHGLQKLDFQEQGLPTWRSGDITIREPAGAFPSCFMGKPAVCIQNYSDLSIHESGCY